MIPSIGSLGLEAGQGNTFGGAAGPSSAGGGGAQFGNIVSGGSGGFNPFGGGASTQLMQPKNLIILGAALIGVAWILKKK